MCKTLVNAAQTLFTNTEKIAKLACLLCKICWSKHPSAFVKVLEGGEIYNFAYYLLGHFSFKMRRKSRSKQSLAELFHTPVPESHAPARRCAQPAPVRMPHRWLGPDAKGACSPTCVRWGRPTPHRHSSPLPLRHAPRAHGSAARALEPPLVPLLPSTPSSCARLIT
jgi:hypothetical protein